MPLHGSPMVRASALGRQNTSSACTGSRFIFEGAADGMHSARFEEARAQAHGRSARRDRKRRQHLMECSFAHAANNHHFMRARWRRLWRQQIQDYLIASIQNVRILLAHQKPKPSTAAAMLPPLTLVTSLNRPWHRSARPFCTPHFGLTNSPITDEQSIPDHLGNRP
jgi:hypothetical protein